MEIRGRVINAGDVEGEAFVLETPFNFTGDFDPVDGTLTVQGHPLSGQKIGGKIWVMPGGKGAVGASIIIYNAKKRDNAPIGIICKKADPLTVECAMTIDIPLMDSLEKDPITHIKNGDHVVISGEGGFVRLKR